MKNTSSGERSTEGTDDFALTRRKFLLAGSAAVAAVMVAPIAKEAQALAAQTIGSEAEPAVLSKVSFEVNGKACELELDTRTTLLDALREHLHLTGSKKGCDHGQCGACTVLVNTNQPCNKRKPTKGVGELGLCGVAAAIANAIYNATGVRVRDYPITPDKLIDGLPEMV